MASGMRLSTPPEAVGGNPADHPIQVTISRCSTAAQHAWFPDACLADEALRAFQHQGMCRHAVLGGVGRSTPACLEPVDSRRLPALG